MRKKMTPWFPISSKPKREGLYRVQDYSLSCNCCWWEAIWKDGAWWHYGKALGMDVRREVRDIKRWRGLTAKSDFA